MQHLVRTIVSALVDYPEAVEVQQVDGETTCILEVRVSPADIGKVIGRQGRKLLRFAPCCMRWAPRNVNTSCLKSWKIAPRQRDTKPLWSAFES
jgi:hypothetical protein